MNIEKMYEDRFGQFPLSNITFYLIVGNVITYCLVLLYPHVAGSLSLQGSRILGGEWWRLITMLFVPFNDSPVWVVFGWYLAYIFGSALEHVWGAFRYALYIFISYLCTLILAFLFPKEIFTNAYIYASAFLAFAYLAPNYVLYLFFIIPVKIKWFALLAWIGMLGAFLSGDWHVKLQNILAVFNFLLFFGNDIYLRVTGVMRRGPGRIGSTMQSQKTYMRCVVCKKTEHDQKIFYYCHDCAPERCYCEDHIRDHTHIGQSN